MKKHAVGLLDLRPHIRTETTRSTNPVLTNPRMHEGDRNQHFQGHPLSVPKTHFADLPGPPVDDGRTEEAQPHFGEAIRPDEVTHCNLGSAYSDTGREKEAEETYFLSLSISPDYVAAHCNYIRLLHKQEKSDEALNHYRRALEIKPDFAQARMALRSMEELLQRQAL